jgi:hypothetical protein
MACNRNATSVTRAGAGSGVSVLSNRLSYVTGAIAGRATQAAGQVDQAIERTGQIVAPAAQVVLRATNNLQAEPAARGALSGTMLAASLLVPPLRTARRLLRRFEQVSSLGGDLVGALSKTETSGEVIREKRTLFFFKSQVPVTLWQSRLTGLLNRQDLIGVTRFAGQNVIASEGVMFRTGNKTWHCGTTVVKTGQGKRTITHLQSLSLPNSHYYFSQPLSNQDAVGIASGQTKPETISGFVGQVSSAEALCPLWTDTKHALIKTQLYWPGKSTSERIKKP